MWRIMKDFPEHEQPHATKDRVLKWKSSHASWFVLPRPQAAGKMLAAKEDVFDGKATSLCFLLLTATPQ